MRVYKALTYIIPISAALLAWLFPFGILYGLLIGTIAAVALFVSHKTKENILLKVVITLCMIFFYGCAISAYAINYITG
jgi:hypothetical protein